VNTLVTQAVSNVRITVWRACLVTRDINHVDSHKPYQPHPMVCYKPYSTVKQVYAHAQRLGLQSARSTQRGKHNRTLTLPRFHL